MKGLLLIGVGFLLFSSTLFGFEEIKEEEMVSQKVQQESLYENKVSFPSDSPVVIPEYDIAFADQRKPNQEKKVKAFSHCGQGFNSLNYYSHLNRDEWEKSPTFQVLRFILFCNLRL